MTEKSTSEHQSVDPSAKFEQGESHQTGPHPDSHKSVRSENECHSNESKSVRAKEDSIELRADRNGMYYHENGGRGTGPAPSRHRQDKGLPSWIDSANRDAKGQPLSSNQRNRANRLRRWHNRIHLNGSREQSLRTGLDEVNRTGSALGVDNSTREVAVRLFRQAAEKDLLVGRAIESIASACIYTAARVGGYPRTFDEVGRVSRVNRSRIVNGFEVLRDEFELSIEPVDPTVYLSRFANHCGASHDVVRLAREIIRTAQADEGNEKSILGGASPVSISAAGLYAASIINEADITQRDVAQAAGIHETTIRNNYRDLLDHFEAQKKSE